MRSSIALEVCGIGKISVSGVVGFLIVISFRGLLRASIKKKREKLIV